MPPDVIPHAYIASKFDFGWGLPPDPTGELTLPRPLDAFKGEGKRGRREWKGRKKEGNGGKGKGRGGEEGKEGRKGGSKG